MTRLLVEINVPSIGDRFDVLIPQDMTVEMLSSLLKKSVIKLSDGLFVSTGAVLCDSNTGLILDSNKTVADIGLKNGSRLMLV